MSGRCKCCNSILEEWELKSIDPLTGTYTELCDLCINESDDYEDFGISPETISINEILE